MLHLLINKDALLICSLFCVFMHTITGREGSATVGLGVGIKNADVQECTLMSAPPPEAICSNVQAGAILRDRGSSGKSLLRGVASLINPRRAFAQRGLL